VTLSLITMGQTARPDNSESVAVDESLRYVKFWSIIPECMQAESRAVDSDRA
jgi:hypothetical protein